MKEMIVAAENEALIVTNLAAIAAVPAATMTRRPEYLHTSLLEIYKKKQFPLRSAMKGAGKFRGKPSGSGGKYGAGRNIGCENFMDAKGDFCDSRSHFNWELVRQRIEIVLHTITPQPRMYCIDTGSNTFIANHLILQFRNLRKLKKRLLLWELQRPPGQWQLNKCSTWVR